MIRKTLTLVCALGMLSACSSGGGTSPIFRTIKGLVLPEKEEAGTTPAASGGGLTRAKIVESGLAFIRVQLDGDGVSNILSATSLNGRYVTFVSSFQQTVTLKGSLVTATRGLGGDLLAVNDIPTDPIANVTATADWPSQITRQYRFPDVGPEGKLISVSCSFAKGADMKVTIVEIEYEVTAFTEVCRGDDVSFTNVHLADETGQLWQTRQWVGPNLGYINVEVLEPVTFD